MSAKKSRTGRPYTRSAAGFRWSISLPTKEIDHTTLSIESRTPESFSSARLQHADVAMYRAKSIDRNRFQSYSIEMSVQSQERLELECALRVAVERGAVGAALPATGRARGRPHRRRRGTAALAPPHAGHGVARTLHPRGRGNRADHPAPKARHGMQAATRNCPWRSTCRQSQFQQQDVPALVRDVLCQTRMPANHLELELTESR